MRLTLKKETCKAVETVIGIPCDQIRKAPLIQSQKQSKPKKTKIRQVGVRGSIYLQLGRKAQKDQYINIVSRF